MTSLIKTTGPMYTLLENVVKDMFGKFPYIVMTDKQNKQGRFEYVVYVKHPDGRTTIRMDVEDGYSEYELRIELMASYNEQVKEYDNRGR